MLGQGGLQIHEQREASDTPEKATWGVTEADIG